MLEKFEIPLMNNAIDEDQSSLPDNSFRYSPKRLLTKDIMSGRNIFECFSFFIDL
jgi:hypothetical protein